MKNRNMIRKYVAILVLSVCSIVSAFAQGTVVGYANPKDLKKHLKNHLYLYFLN